MAKRKIEFTQGDVHLAGFLFDNVTAEPGRLERMGSQRRWLVIEPASGTPDVSIEVNVGDGDPDAMNVIVNQTGTEPGKPIYPEIAERGAKTPSGWILMTDVGWVIGWRAPKDTTLDQVSDFGVPRPQGRRRRARRRPLGRPGRQARPPPRLHEPEDLTALVRVPDP